MNIILSTFGLVLLLHSLLHGSVPEYKITDEAPEPAISACDNLSPEGVAGELNRFLAEGMPAAMSAGRNACLQNLQSSSFECRKFPAAGTKVAYTCIGIRPCISYPGQTKKAEILCPVDKQWQASLPQETGTKHPVSPGLLLSLDINNQYSFKSNHISAISYHGPGLGIGIL
jgi:hypothetical protein